MSSQKIKRPDRSKPQRTPLGKRNKLTFSNLDPNFEYRVINDTDDRLNAALEAGYEFVESEEKLGDERVAEASAVDSRVSKQVGGGTTGYLMRIPKEWYDEDQKAKQDKVNEVEKSTKPANSDDYYGKGLTNE